MVEGLKNVIDDSLPPRNDEPQIPDTRKSFDMLADHLQEVMVESLPTMVYTHIKEQVKKQVLKPFAVRPRDQDDPHDDAYPEGENSAKRQKTSEYEAYGWSVLSGEESIKEILVSPHPRKTTPLVQTSQRDLEAPALSLINQDLLYLKKGSSGPEKIVLSLHKFPAIIFNDDDIEERTSRWPDYKNLNKNDIEDMYLLIMNGKVPDYAETGLLWEALVSVYNRFAQLMNDLERNDMHFPIVTINTKFLNSLQPEWLKYVTQVCLAKRLTVDTFDDLFYYLQQFEKLVNVSRAKKLEKSHDPLALVAHTGSSSRNTSSYYVTHPTSVVDYEDEYQQDDVHTNSEDPLTSAMLLLARAITQNFSTPTNNRLRTSSNTRNQAIIQGDRVNIQSRNSGNAGRNNRRAYVQEEIVEGSNAPNETGNVQRTLRTSSSGNTSTVQCYNCSGKGHYARNCPKPRVRDSKYFMEQMLLAK
ncbi:retrovirus-related pol polyprotein from transposon TNT 1-94 [Tanacetum coccineum]